MTNEESLKIYQSMAQPPQTALRTIEAGRLKGKTDINPQWRYRIMTETFGLVGVGWKYEIQKLWNEQGAAGEILSFAQVAVFIKIGEKWSEPIVGIGGSKLVEAESKGLHSNDEGYKMAVTDAFSTSLKMIGVAADIYAGKWDGSKYKDNPTEQPLKGGNSTPEESKEISNLLKSEYSDGGKIFTVDEIRAFLKKRESEYTAQQLITVVKNEIQRRIEINKSRNV